MKHYHKLVLVLLAALLMPTMAGAEITATASETFDGRYIYAAYDVSCVTATATGKSVYTQPMRVPTGTAGVIVQVGSGTIDAGLSVVSGAISGMTFEIYTSGDPGCATDEMVKVPVRSLIYGTADIKNTTTTALVQDGITSGVIQTYGVYWAPVAECVSVRFNSAALSWTSQCIIITPKKSQVWGR